jgi:hypothetical protein
VLQVDDIVARYLPPLGGVIVFAVGVCPLAGPASREPWVASCLALSGSQRWRRGTVDNGYALTVRQRQQAVKVWAMRVWPLTPSSDRWGAASVVVCVAVATSMARPSPGAREEDGCRLMMLGLWGEIDTRVHHQHHLAASFRLVWKAVQWDGSECAQERHRHQHLQHQVQLPNNHAAGGRRSAGCFNGLKWLLHLPERTWKITAPTYHPSANGTAR